MKNLILISICLVSTIVFSQNTTIIDVVLNNKPAKLNTITGEIVYANAVANHSVVNNNTIKATTNNHTVTKGETLYSISKHYGVSVAQLKSLNNLSSNVLSIGDSLIIKTSNTNHSTIKANSSSHIVKERETLYGIAKQYNLTVAKLKSINNLTSNILSVGQVLKIN